MNQQLFMMGTQPRSGTHMLRTALHRHPEIACRGEIFNHESWEAANSGIMDYHKISERMEFLLDTNPKPFVGFCLHNKQYGHPHHKHPHNGDWDSIPISTKVIRLRRRNRLACMVSSSKAQRLQAWQWYTKDYVKCKPWKHANPNIGFEPFVFKFEELVHTVKRNQRQEQSYMGFEKRFSKILPVWYEDLVENWEREIQRITDFLGTHYVDVAPQTRKSGFGVRATISNYDELRETCRNTQYEVFFDEDI